MKNADLLIAHNKGAYTIIVEGRANFDYGLPLRDFAKKLDSDFKSIAIDLRACLGMDSTFMGIMAMIGLKAQKNNVKVEILNADDNNKYLLEGLGLDKLFTFANKDTCNICNEKVAPEEDSCNILKKAETVLEGHRTLTRINPKNIPKFDKVIEFAQDDVDKLKKKK